MDFVVIFSFEEIYFNDIFCLIISFSIRATTFEYPFDHYNY